MNVGVSGRLIAPIYTNICGVYYTHIHTFLITSNKGARQSRAGFKQGDLNEIQRATGLSPQQIQQLQSEFFQAAGRDGVLNMNEFANVYFRFPSSRNQPNLQQ